ncbi:Interleukin-8 [Merluccius polli]|uniref:Interleukin-8 n=1 Tax=Merluccius polli TaxID=89951 RepID=A0AA47P974_MERPO|nr:Interleukin-8 [Merluccius polli]
MKMTSSKITISTLLVLLALLTITEGIRVRGLGIELGCRCNQTESRPIGRHIKKVEINPANSHCEDSEIIATLKKTGQEVCLDPEAPWVKSIIVRMMSSATLKKTGQEVCLDPEAPWVKSIIVRMMSSLHPPARNHGNRYQGIVVLYNRISRGVIFGVWRCRRIMYASSPHHIYLSPGIADIIHSMTYVHANIICSSNWSHKIQINGHFGLTQQEVEELTLSLLFLSVPEAQNEHVFSKNYSIHIKQPL